LRGVSAERPPLTTSSRLPTADTQPISETFELRTCTATSRVVLGGRTRSAAGAHSCVTTPGSRTSHQFARSRRSVRPPTGGEGPTYRFSPRPPQGNSPRSTTTPRSRPMPRPPGEAIRASCSSSARIALATLRQDPRPIVATSTSTHLGSWPETHARGSKVVAVATRGHLARFRGALLRGRRDPRDPLRNAVGERESLGTFETP
jgi:hypothetical protein